MIPEFYGGKTTTTNQQQQQQHNTKQNKTISSDPLKSVVVVAILLREQCQGLAHWPNVVTSHPAHLLVCSWRYPYAMFEENHQLRPML